MNKDSAAWNSFVNMVLFIVGLCLRNINLYEF